MSDHCRSRSLGRVTLFVLTLALLLPATVAASTARELDRRVIARIRSARPNAKIVLPNVILSDTETRTIELEEFSLYAADAVILVYDSAGPRRIAPPSRRYFKGRVADDPSATVFFSLSTNSSEVDGLITIGDKKYVIAQGRRLAGQRIPDSKRATPILVAEIDSLTDRVENQPFRCGTDEVTVPLRQLPNRLKPASLAVTTTQYELRIGIETDNELYAAFGAPGSATTAALNTYIGDLVAKASVIYMRDLGTKLNLGQVNIRPTDVPDPFSAETGFAALGEFGKHWHDTYPLVPRSAAVMVSGRYLGGGVAWVDKLCVGDFPCGPNGCFGIAETANHWAGAYAVNGSGGELVVPDPNLTTVDGIVYGQPANHSWMLQSFTHELGHVIGSPHTHCVGLTPVEKAAYGVARNFVDECSTASNCNTTYGGVPTEKGTIMSYCYLQTRYFEGSSYPESRYLFGKAGETSEKMLAILDYGLYGATPDSFMTVGDNLSCAAGQTASVYNCGTGCTYAWVISGGSIQGSATSNSISFTPTSANVVLTATITTERGCGVKTTSAITSQCVATLAAPANLIAIAATSSSVNLSWSAVTNATSYEVVRSDDGIAYVTVGTPTGTAFTDSSSAANTSYLYKVGARAGAEIGPSSPPDLATTVIFSNEPLNAESSVINALHMTQLRTAVNAAHVLARLGPVSFTDSIGALVPVKKIHVDELRSNLDAARTALGLIALGYTDPSITASSTTIRAAHFNELRNGVK